MRRKLIIAVASLLIVSLAPVASAVAPAAPTGLTITSQTDETVSLSWTQSANFNDADFAGHHIYKDGAQAAYLAKETGCCAVVVGSLMPATNYCFDVSASNQASEESGKSNQVCTTTDPVATPPGAPQNLIVNTQTQDSISLSWSAPATGDPPNQYNMYVDGVQTGSYGGTAATVIDLQANTNYCFEVSGQNGAGEGPKSNQVCHSTDPTTATPPTAPQSFVAEPWDNEYTITWAAPASDGGDPVQSYNLYENGVLAQSFSTAGFTHTRAATNAASLAISFHAVNAAGEGPGATATITIGAPDAAPAAPTLIAPTQATSSTIDLNWEIPHSGGLADTWHVYVNGVEDSSTAASLLTVDQLLASTNYCFTVKGLNAHGFGPASNEQCFSTLATTASAPTAPLNLQYAITPCDCGQGAQIDLTWSAPASDGGAPLQFYNVYLDGVFVDFVAGNAVAPAITLTGNDGFGEGTHTIEVKARNEAGESPAASATVSINYAEIPGVTPKSSGGGVEVIEGPALVDYIPGLILVFGFTAAAYGYKEAPKQKKRAIAIIAATLGLAALIALIYPTATMEALGLA